MTRTRVISYKFVGIIIFGSRDIGRNVAGGIRTFGLQLLWI